MKLADIETPRLVGFRDCPEYKSTGYSSYVQMIAQEELYYRNYAKAHGDAVASNEYPSHSKLRNILSLDIGIKNP